MNVRFSFVLLALLTFFGLLPSFSHAQSQGGEYKGITDPFGDPANYEFQEDEKEDKEFFHLGRYLMLGVDFGAGFFTGGLGRTNAPGFLIGAKILYFFDRAIALEAAVDYANDIDTLSPNSTAYMQINTDMLPLTIGFRYYFDTRNAPKAIAIANPYLAAGGGVYIRTQSVIGTPKGFTLPAGGGNATTNNFGANAGGGVEFAVYHRHIYLGLDLRYHLVFFNDESQTYGGLADRSGDYVTGRGSISYNF